MGEQISFGFEAGDEARCAVQEGLHRSARSRGRARSGDDRGWQASDWTPERVAAYLGALGVGGGLVVGPDVLKLLSFGGVRRVFWEEEKRRGCFPVPFAPVWRWEPYFVSAPAVEGGFGGIRGLVALVREPRGLRPYWLVSRFDREYEEGFPIRPAPFVIGEECLALAGPRPPARFWQVAEGAAVLEEALEPLRGHPVSLEMYTCGPLGHVSSGWFLLLDFRVEGRVEAGLKWEGSARVLLRGESGFELEVGCVRGFRAFPGYLILDAFTERRGYGNSVTVRWGRG